MRNTLHLKRSKSEKQIPIRLGVLDPFHCRDELLPRGINSLWQFFIHISGSAISSSPLFPFPRVEHVGYGHLKPLEQLRCCVLARLEHAVNLVNLA